MNNTGKTFTNAEWREEAKYDYLKKKAAWKGHENEAITPANSRELEGDSLIYSAFREGISLLDHMELEYGTAPSMKDYGKILVWTATKLKENFQKEIEKNKKDGWVVTAHHWPGEDGSLRSSLNLNQTQQDESFFKKYDEGRITWEGLPIET